MRAGSARFLFFQDSLPAEPGAMHGVNLCFECRAAGTLALDPESTEALWLDPDAIDTLEIAFRGADALRRYWRLPGVNEEAPA